MKAFSKITNDYTDIIYPKTTSDMVEVEGGGTLQEALENIVDISITNDLQTQINTKASKTYVDGEIGELGISVATDITNGINARVNTHASSNDHDGRYYTETEVNNLLNGKANSTHTHTPTQAGLDNVDNVKQMPIAGGTFTGQAKAQNNTAYTTAQLRNIVLSTANPSGGGDGDIWIKYRA